MSLLRLLALFVSFLRPGVGEPDPAADPKPADDPQPELDLDSPDPDPAPADEPNPEEVETLRREARENKEAREKVERELAETRLRFQAPAPQSEEDRIRAEEEKVLKDEKATELQRWQVQSNRVLRQNTNAAQYALAQAHDVSDRTAFTSITMSDPVAKRYESRVEQELAQVRAKGGNASRESIYTYLLGKDMRDGKFKKKVAPSVDGKPSAVNRGKLPGARSDASARGTASDREKRKERLRNVQI